MTILLGLVLLPVLFRTLPKEELGIWLLLGQSWATLGILDLGFGVTITRRIAFAKGRSGSDPNTLLTDTTHAEIADLLATGLRIYRILALISFVVAFSLGFFYLRSLNLDALTMPVVWTAWGILCLSQALTMWATPWTCLLQGVGYVGWDAILASFVNASTLIAQIIVAMFGGGLVSLAIVAATGALLQRTAILGFSRRKRPELFQFSGQWRNDTFRELTPLALKAWLTSLGTVMVLNTDQLFVATIEGTENLPAYRAAYIIFLNINMLAVTVASASYVYVAQLWQAGDIPQVHNIVVRNLQLGLFGIAAGGGFVLGMGTNLFDLWLGPGNFIGGPIASIFFVLMVLEAQCYILTAASRATEDEAFAGTTIVAGVLKLTLAFVLGKSFGLSGIALSTLVAQLLTNHWYMVYRALTRLNLNVWSYWTKVVFPVIVVAILVYVISRGLAVLTTDVAQWVSVTAGALIAGVLFAVASWCLAMEKTQRNWVLIRMGLSKA